MSEKKEKILDSSATQDSSDSSKSSGSKQTRCAICGAEISTLEKGISKVINSKPFGIKSKNGCVMTPLDVMKNAGRICIACTIKGKAKRK